MGALYSMEVRNEEWQKETRETGRPLHRHWIRHLPEHYSIPIRDAWDYRKTGLESVEFWLWLQLSHTDKRPGNDLKCIRCPISSKNLTYPFSVKNVACVLWKNKLISVLGSLNLLKSLRAFFLTKKVFSKGRNITDYFKTILLHSRFGTKTL